MSRQKKLNGVQCEAAKLLATVCGYSTSRIAELLLPFADDAAHIDVGVLQKRILRIQKEATSFPTAEPGTFLLHRIGLEYGGKSEFLLFVMEVHTGWINVVALPKIRIAEIKAALNRIFKEIESEYGAKLHMRQIMLATYQKPVKETPMEKQKQPTDNQTEPATIEIATVIGVPVAELIDDLRGELLPGLRKRVVFVTRQLEDGDEVFKLDDKYNNYSKPQLNKLIRKILNQFNLIDREKHRFPTTTEPVTPAVRLYRAQTNLWKEYRKQQNAKQKE